MSSQIEIDLLGGLLPLVEKKTLLNHFIEKAEESEVNVILKKAKTLPSTQLYSLLKFMLADKFHRIDLIIELLYDGDSTVLRRATSKKWLYETENSAFTDSDFLINKLFPNVSYDCRQKVLYRIGRYVRNVDKADKIWNAVEHKYGFHVACPLLQACSKDKINSLIANRKVELSGYQLVQILQKYPEIGLAYLRNQFTNIGSDFRNSYRSPLAYLYENRPDDFLDLCLNHFSKINYFQFGSSRSTKIIRAYRQRLLEKPRETSSLLNIDRIRREFSSDEFQIFFESSIGAVAVDNVNYDKMWNKWVNTVPVYKRVDMVNRAFTKLFQVNLDEHFELMSTEYLVLLPEEKRLSAVQWKSENDSNFGWSFRGIYEYWFTDEEQKRAWLPMKPISHSIPELQKLLLIEQDVAARTNLSKYLVETCYINNDLPQLLNVLLLLNKRCRNDQSEVRTGIFQSLGTIMQRMEFTKQHWDVIMEMIQVGLVLVDSRDYSDNDKERLVARCIAFHLKSNATSDNLVSMHIRLKIRIGSSTWTNSYVKNEADRRCLLELYAKELEKLQLANDLRSHNGRALEPEKLSEFVANLIEEICKFNKRTAKNSLRKLEPISIASNQWLRTSLEKIAKEEEDRINKKSNVHISPHSWNFAEQLVNIIQVLRKEQNISLDAFKDSESFLSSVLHTSPCTSILTHFLCKNPSQLIVNGPTTVSKMLKRESGLKFMRNLKLWNYSTLTDQAIRTCLQIIDQTLDHDSEITIQQKCNATLVLSVLSKSSDFLSLVEKFYPTESKVDVFVDKSKEDYQIRQAMAKSLLNVTPSHLTFPAVERFCVGDYLNIAIAALYLHSGRASETETLNFLRQKLFQSPVSLQKHIIRLYFGISSVEQQICASTQIDSCNVTIRYEMFLRTNKLFRSSPYQETWTILKDVIEKTSSEDAAIILYVHTKPKLDTCPIEYLSDYTITCLTLLRKVKPEKVDEFMNHLESVMDKLPETTLDEVILPKNVEQTSFSAMFCVEYIQGSSTESVAEHRLSNIWLLLQNVMRHGWDIKTEPLFDSNPTGYPTRIVVFALISTLSFDQMNDASKAWLKVKTLQSLLEKLKAESVSKFFREILYLELGLLLVKEVGKSGSERLRSFGKSLAGLTDSLVETYGGEIILLVKDAVADYSSQVSDEYVKNTGVLVEMIDEILETSKSRSNQIISLFLLQLTYPTSSKLVATLQKINTVLRESTDVVVQMYYGSVIR